MRFQLASEAAALEPMFGKKMKVTAKLSDKDGAVGQGEAWLTLSADYTSPFK